MNLTCVRVDCRYGSTYIFQALPRSMTIWLDYGAKVGSGNSTMKELNDVVKKYTAELDIWQFLTVCRFSFVIVISFSDFVEVDPRTVLIHAYARRFCRNCAHGFVTPTGTFTPRLKAC